VIPVSSELLGARGALLERLLPVAFQHQVGGAPDIDLGYHGGKIRTVAVDKRLTPIIAWLRVKVAADGIAIDC
jgi:hypothetical protein